MELKLFCSYAPDESSSTLWIDSKTHSMISIRTDTHIGDDMVTLIKTVNEIDGKLMRRTPEKTEITMTRKEYFKRKLEGSL